MENLTDYIYRHLNKDNDFLVEGIHVDSTNKIITLNDTTKGVDFNGPIEYPAKDITVISIFKRTPYEKDDKNKDIDGNPFIYALKEKDDWKFQITNEEINKYCRKFISNCEKLHRTFDTIIMIPTTSKINERFMEVISKYVKSKINIKDMFNKQKLQPDPYLLIDYDKIYKDFNYSEWVEREIEQKLNAQKRAGKKYFEAKSFPKEYLKYIKSLTLSGKDYSKELCDKDVLILDDTYSSGETISRAVDAIKANYSPKSITAITLLSKKFKK